MRSLSSLTFICFLNRIFFSLLDKSIKASIQFAYNKYSVCILCYLGISNLNSCSMKKSSVITFRTSSSEVENLKVISKNSRISKSECCRLALRLFLHKYGKNMDELLYDYSELLDADKEDLLNQLKESYEDIQHYTTKKVDFEDIFGDQ